MHGEQRLLMQLLVSLHVHFNKLLKFVYRWIWLNLVRIKCNESAVKRRICIHKCKHWLWDPHSRNISLPCFRWLLIIFYAEQNLLDISTANDVFLHETSDLFIPLKRLDVSIFSLDYAKGFVQRLKVTRWFGFSGTPLDN